MAKLLKNMKSKDWCFAGFVLFLVIVQVWLELTMPDFTKKLTESVSAQTIQTGDVIRNGALMLLCAFASMLTAIFCGLFSALIAADFAKITRTKIFSHILTFSSKEINTLQTPSLITRTTNDIVQLQFVLAIGLPILFKAPILAVSAIAKISTKSIEWTAAVFVCVIIMGLTAGSLVAIAYPKFKQIQKLTDSLNDSARENISGVRVVRAFNAEKFQQKKFEKVNSDITKKHLFTSRLLGLMMPIMTLCLSGLTLAIYWIGAYLINKAEVPQRATIIGEMTAFSQYALQVVAAFIMLVAIFVILPRVMVSVRRLNEVFDTKPSIEYKSEKVNTNETGTIEFKNVSFSYNDSAEPCLNNISFKINRGETFAIIGATGTGKSTLINLIPRYYDVTGGEILIDGVNIKEYPEEQLEKMISLAPQKAILFKGDIKSNITYGHIEEISDEDDRIKKSIEIAQADFIYEKENGIHAEVAQGGTNYSGGQKQRLSIARAVFKNSEIMIFDDTFSALDYKTDMLVRKSIKDNLKDTTVIIVAQRIGTIKNADKILVLSDGNIAGLGKHSELLDNCPIYKEIALSQLSKEEL